MLLLFGGATAWYTFAQRDSRTLAASSPLAFSIAILPFASPGESAVDEAAARDATRSLTEAVGTRTGLWVISPGLASTYRGNANDPRVLGRELNVRYVVEGELRHAGDRISLITNLIDTGTAAQVWTGRAEVDDAKNGTSALTVPPQLISGLLKALVSAEIRRVARQGPSAAGAMDLVIRGWALDQDDYSLDRVLRATKLYDEALRLDPNLVPALLSRADSSLHIARIDPRADRNALLREADELTNRALALDPGNPSVWSTRGWVLALQRRSEESLTAYRESLRIAPDRTGTINAITMALIWSGRAEESLPWIDKALEYSSGQALALLNQRNCSANTLLGRYDAAALACEKSVALGSDASSYVYLTAIYAQLGQDAKATSAKERLLRGWPDFTLERWKLFIASDNKVYWDQVETHLFAGLRKVGIRER